eukprot:superscaffoldBa00010940_g24962
MESGSEIEYLEKIYQDLEEENNEAAEAWRKEQLALHRRIELLHREKRELTIQQEADSRLLVQLTAMAAEVEEQCFQARLKVKPHDKQCEELRHLYLAEVKKEAELKKKI